MYTYTYICTEEYVMTSKYDIEYILFSRILAEIHDLPTDEVPLQQALLRKFKACCEELKKEFHDESDKERVRDILKEFFGYISWYNTRRIRGRLRMAVRLFDKFSLI